MNNLVLFIIGFSIFSFYMFFLVRMIWKQHKIQEQNDQQINIIPIRNDQDDSIAS